MSSFQAGCPHCGQILELQEEWRGIECTCPACNQKFVIPTAAEAAAPPKNHSGHGFASDKRRNSFHERNTGDDAVKTRIFTQKIDGLLASLRERDHVSTGRLFENGIRALVSWGILAVGAVVAITGLVIMARLEGKRDFNEFLCFVPLPLLLGIIGNYISDKFSGSLHKIIHRTPCRLSDSALVDVLALLCLIVAVCCLFWGIAVSIQSNSLIIFLIGIGGAVVSYYAAALMLNHEKTLDVRIDAENAGAADAVLSIILIVNKLYVYLIPLLQIAGLCVVIYFCFADKTSEYSHNEMSSYVAAAHMTIALMTLAQSALLPVWGYLSYIFSTFICDIIQAVLSIPKAFKK